MTYQLRTFNPSLFALMLTSIHEFYNIAELMTILQNIWTFIWSKTTYSNTVYYKVQQSKEAT